MDTKLLEILVCPLCKGPLVWRKEARELVCKGDRLAFPVKDDIPVMLEEEARTLGPDEEPGGSPLRGQDLNTSPTTFTVVIPARMRSTRLPGKMLADVAGKPLVAWVVERARSSGAARVVVATDHEDIARALAPSGCETCLTSPAHETGTDRLAEAVGLLGLADADLVVNVQGDEPLIDPRLIQAVAGALAARPEASIATAAHPIHSAQEFFDPNVVKVVVDAAGFAQYFSRAPIPYARDAFAQSRANLPEGLPALRHIGIYAYRVRYLREYAGLAPTPVERFEALEQLRALAHGHRIAVATWNEPMAPGVDTPEDLERVRRQLIMPGCQ